MTGPPTLAKSLDQKLKRLAADTARGPFILADAKDADMAYGISAAGRSPEQHAAEGRFRSIQAYRQLICANVEQGLVDIMLMSAASNEQLTIHQRLFDSSPVTPAVRANDTSDIHLITGSSYAKAPSRPFRTATIDHIMCGKVDCRPPERSLGADLGLYSVTFNNEVGADLATLEAYHDFRLEAERKGFRHFLEVFDPNACGDHCPPADQLPRFINDQISRLLAGVTQTAGPLFLKIPYHGPAAVEQLAGHDRRLIVGILGGASGTTLDAFGQLFEARKYGARAALYGRMINNSEHQPTFIQHLRWLADGQIDDPAEAVRSYHGSLEKLGVQPYRPLAEDLVLTRSPGACDPSCAKAAAGTAAAHVPAAGPVFERMSLPKKIAWNRARWDRILG